MCCSVYRLAIIVLLLPLLLLLSTPFETVSFVLLVSLKRFFAYECVCFCCSFSCYLTLRLPYCSCSRPDPLSTLFHHTLLRIPPTSPLSPPPSTTPAYTHTSSPTPNPCPPSPHSHPSPTTSRPSPNNHTPSQPARLPLPPPP